MVRELTELAFQLDAELLRGVLGTVLGVLLPTAVVPDSPVLWLSLLGALLPAAVLPPSLLGASNELKSICLSNHINYTIYSFTFPGRLVPWRSSIC